MHFENGPTTDTSIYGTTVSDERALERARRTIQWQLKKANPDQKENLQQELANLNKLEVDYRIGKVHSLMKEKQKEELLNELREIDEKNRQ